VTVVLTRGLREVLESFKGSGASPVDPEHRDHVGVLKRLGLVEVERTDEGDTVKVTSAGKDALKNAPGSEDAPDAPAGAFDLPAPEPAPNGQGSSDSS
jgi:hypothetical protein